MDKVHPALKANGGNQPRRQFIVHAGKLNRSICPVGFTDMG
jgi:hypothetical protein